MVFGWTPKIESAWDLSRFFRAWNSSGVMVGFSGSAMEARISAKNAAVWAGVDFGSGDVAPSGDSGGGEAEREPYPESTGPRSDVAISLDCIFLPEGEDAMFVFG